MCSSWTMAREGWMSVIEGDEGENLDVATAVNFGRR